MTPKEKPIKIKCYCGHTIFCDCGPLEDPKENNHSGDANDMISDDDKQSKTYINEYKTNID